MMNFKGSAAGVGALLLGGMAAMSWGAALSLMASNAAHVGYFPILGGGALGSASVGADWMSMGFLGTVSGVASMVFLFSVSYMASEKYKFRFTALLGSFVASMFVLVMSGDVLVLVIGWDALGLTSYLLVLFFSGKKSYNAAMLTALTNRLGDVGVILGIGGALGGHSLSSSGFLLWGDGGSLISGVLLSLSSLTKSAQVPFSSWLPAAMAAPTPVSALVHSSTLVTAGVYLLLRLGPLGSALGADFGLMMVGALTLFLASVAALREMDLKKIVALSTLSQLGLMFLMIGLRQPQVAFFHMNTHAFFKSVLFIGGGDLIHGANSWQDLRKVDFRSSSGSVISLILFGANLSLVGAPFFAGFYSKDLFLEASLMGSQGAVPLGLAYASVVLTAAYALRMVMGVIWMNGKSVILGSLREVYWGSGAYSASLVGLATFGGSALSWALLSCPSAIFIPGGLKGVPLSLLFIVGGWGSRYQLMPGSGVSPLFNIGGLPLMASRCPTFLVGQGGSPLIKTPEKLGLSVEDLIKLAFFGGGLLGSSPKSLSVFLSFSVFIVFVFLF